MKRISLLLLAVVLTVSLSGCGKKADEGQNAPASAAPTESAAPAPVAPSSNKTVVSEKDAPKVFWAMDIVYHLENCSELSGKEAQEVPWSMVKEIGLRQCPVCNPPQYEQYVESSDSE